MSGCIWEFTGQWEIYTLPRRDENWVDKSKKQVWDSVWGIMNTEIERRAKYIEIERKINYMKNEPGSWLWSIEKIFDAIHEVEKLGEDVSHLDQRFIDLIPFILHAQIDHIQSFWEQSAYWIDIVEDWIVFAQNFWVNVDELETQLNILKVKLAVIENL